MTRGIRIFAVVLGAVLFSGFLWGAIGIADRWLFRGELPQGEWWQFLIAIPVIGVVALAFEALGEVTARIFGINKPNTPKWKEYLCVLTMIVTVIAILVMFSIFTE